MCGIIGYVGSRPSKPLLLAGLQRLEYRGYDSAGIALLEADGLEYVRAVGNLQFLKDAAGSNGSVSTTGLGHTRWATHGGVNETECASAHGLRRARSRDRPQRHRRELPRASARSSRRRSHAFVARPTPRWSRTCSRKPTTATSSRPCAPSTSGSRAISRSS